MDSFNDVLDAAKAYCREHTADATYQYYISGLKAVSFENSNCITLEVRNDFICKIVSDRYTGLLKDAFKAVLGFDVEVKFTVPQPEPEAAKEKRPMDEASLPSGRYDFTFENFIKGPSNQFAYAAAQAVAANPSGAYNPLFIYGPSGLGKTHLALAIADAVLEGGHDVLYTSSAALAARLGREHFDYNSGDEWLTACQEADLLIMDDLGTEYITPLTISVLYELINTRMLTERPTIYTTNITDQSIFAARYTEKVASRMLGGCKMFMFMGDDQRMKQG